MVLYFRVILVRFIFLIAFVRNFRFVNLFFFILMRRGRGWGRFLIGLLVRSRSLFVYIECSVVFRFGVGVGERGMLGFIFKVFIV